MRTFFFNYLHIKERTRSDFTGGYITMTISKHLQIGK
jgi:hypothetical protein